MTSSKLIASPVEVAETGTVRIGAVLDVISKALEDYPEARLAVSSTILSELGAISETRILP